MKIFVIILLSIAAYTIGYFLLMIRDFPVVVGGKIQFDSSFRWASPAPRDGDFDMGARAPSFLNYIFLPADEIYYTLHPKGFTMRIRHDPRYKSMLR